MSILICVALFNTAVLCYYFIYSLYLFFLYYSSHISNSSSNSLPKGFTIDKIVGIGSEERKTYIAPNRDRFLKKKIPTDLDAIIIGSGIGGLSCAAFLSRVGKRCLVLEQHYIAGGCTHSFVEHGYEFDTGVHYVGNIEKRREILDLITDTPLEWDKMGEDNDSVYDEFYIGDKSYNFRAGKENYIEDLVLRFPSEREAIEEYVRLCVEVSKKDLFFNLKIVRPRWLSYLINWFYSNKFFRMNEKTAVEVICELTSNKDLQAILLSQFADYTHTPGNASFFLHASVANHYFDGGWFPRGGSSEIANKIIPTIEKTGGRVLVGRGVSSVIIENGRACGVMVDVGGGGDGDNGLAIRAPIVISACGVINTYKFLPPEVIPTYVAENINKIGTSGTMVYLFVGMKGTPESLKLRSSNIWHWPTLNGDYDEMLEKFYNDPEEAPVPAFIGFPCAKDSTWSTRFPGKSNAVILTMIDYKTFKKWENSEQGKRGADYEALKKVFEKRILEVLFEYYPQCRDAVDFTLVGSPLTFNHYIGSSAGEVYGLDGTCDRFQINDWLRPETDIPGLYLTGCDVTTLGITGGLMSGVLTAHAVLGYGTVWDLITGRNLVSDIMKGIPL